jgi:hypothetical protein
MGVGTMINDCKHIHAQIIRQDYDYRDGWDRSIETLVNVAWFGLGVVVALWVMP